MADWSCLPNLDLSLCISVTDFVRLVHFASCNVCYRPGFSYFFFCKRQENKYLRLVGQIDSALTNRFCKMSHA